MCCATLVVTHDFAMRRISTREEMTKRVLVGVTNKNRKLETAPFKKNSYKEEYIENADGFSKVVPASKAAIKYGETFVGNFERSAKFRQRRYGVASIYPVRL